MKYILIKFNKIICMSAIIAGIIFSCCAFSRGLPSDVFVDGVNVGGMSVSAAIGAIRKNTVENLAGRKLIVSGSGRNYAFAYPEVGFKDDLSKILPSARRGGRYSSGTRYYLNGLDEVVNYISDSEYLPPEEPYAEFKASGAPFSYFAGKDGKAVDKSALKDVIKSSLSDRFEPIKIKYINIYRKKTLSEIKSQTKLLAKFTTDFDGSNVNRSSNIRLAASKLSGLKLLPGEELSFNSAVGARTVENGFLTAKIIENGEFVEGVGGGVCQASTTLYNAAVLAGLEITEYHPHSLAVGYVPPSRDAMVSGSACDLKFKNVSPLPVYIRSRASYGSVTFEIYGKSDGASYSFVSEVTGSVPAPEEFTDDKSLIKDGKDGLESCGYLEITRGGYTKRTLLRKDRYLPVKRISLKPEEEADTEKSSEPDEPELKIWG